MIIALSAIENTVGEVSNSVTNGPVLIYAGLLLVTIIAVVIGIAVNKKKKRNVQRIVRTKTVVVHDTPQVNTVRAYDRNGMLIGQAKFKTGQALFGGRKDGTEPDTPVKKNGLEIVYFPIATTERPSCVSRRAFSMCYENGEYIIRNGQPGYKMPANPLSVFGQTVGAGGMILNPDSEVSVGSGEVRLRFEFAPDAVRGN